MDVRRMELDQVVGKRVERDAEDRVEPPLFIRSEQDVAAEHELRARAVIDVGTRRHEVALDPVPQPLDISPTKDLVRLTEFLDIRAVFLPLPHPSAVRG